TEYVGLGPDLTAAQAIDRLRELEPNAESVYYLYVVDAQENLTGVLSLRDLIVARPDTPIRDIMTHNVVKAQLDTPAGEVAEALRKYNLLAVPVTDVDGHMEGMVTVDDVMEHLFGGAAR